MKIFLIIISLLWVAGISAQGLKFEDREELLNGLFFDLDIDAGDDVLIRQIETHPTIHFTTTGTSDTIVVGKQSYILTTPKQFGMPEYKVIGGDKNSENSDSTFLFLGGGMGVLTNEHEANPKSFTIETVEVIRYFSDAKKANEAYLKFCSQLAEMLPETDAYDWNDENGSSTTYDLENKTFDGHIYGKQLVVEMNQIMEAASPVYIISLSYEKSILNGIL